MPRVVKTLTGGWPEGLNAMSEDDISNLTGCLPRCNRDEISLEGTPDSRSWAQNHNPQLMMRFHFRDSSYTLRQG